MMMTSQSLLFFQRKEILFVFSFLFFFFDFLMNDFSDFTMIIIEENGNRENKKQTKGFFAAGFLLFIFVLFVQKKE